MKGLVQEGNKSILKFFQYMQNRIYAKTMRKTP